MPEGHFVLYGVYNAAVAATMESLVTDIQYTVLIRFPVIARCSKGVTTFIEFSCRSSGFIYVSAHAYIIQSTSRYNTTDLRLLYYILMYFGYSFSMKSND